MPPQRELTYGEKMVGITFNVENDPKVQKIKEMYAALIDFIWNDMGSYQVDSVKMMLGRESIMDALKAQMAAVKTVTYKY